MLYEHKVKDYEQAYIYTEIGNNLLPVIPFQKESHLQNQRKNWQKRLSRLEIKRNKNFFDKK